MSENRKIEWCDPTFNTLEGCQKVRPGRNPAVRAYRERVSEDGYSCCGGGVDRAERGGSMKAVNSPIPEAPEPGPRQDERLLFRLGAGREKRQVRFFNCRPSYFRGGEFTGPLKRAHISCGGNDGISINIHWIRISHGVSSLKKESCPRLKRNLDMPAIDSFNPPQGKAA
jgi:hypothetical protein